MCGTSPSSHWPRKSMSSSCQARGSSKVEKPRAAKPRIPVPLEGIEPLRRDRVPAQIVVAQNGAGPLDEFGHAILGCQFRARPVSLSSQRRPAGVGLKVRTSPGFAVMPAGAV